MNKYNRKITLSLYGLIILRAFRFNFAFFSFLLSFFLLIFDFFYREITGFLFLHSIQHLKSLGSLFPNLTLIRGERLFSHYALVIYDMNDLEEVSVCVFLFVCSFFLFCFCCSIFCCLLLCATAIFGSHCAFNFFLIDNNIR